MNDVNELEHQLDLLVDGELDQAARRDLLVHLDRETDGWRHCAMAFLEAQSWCDELGHLAGEPLDTASQQNSPGPTRRPFPLQLQRALHGRLTSILAVAAGLLLAFTLGVEFQERRLASEAEPNSDAAQLADSAVGSDRTPATTAARPRAGIPHLASGANPEVFDAWTVGDSEIVPADVLEALQRLGHRVERHQEFWPYNLQDGRRFVVPVERVEVRYIGDNFQ